MKMKFKIMLLMLLTLNLCLSQEKDEVLLKVDGEPVMVSEFLRVYNKNLDLVKDESQKDIDGYLKLFTEYQLKLKEAKRLKLHEDPNYQREFLKYKKQLTKNYLSENKVTDGLVQEAYERTTTDINASHVLVRLNENATDTLNAYNQVLKLRERVLNEGFEAVKADVHNGQTIFLEDLGYFSAFKMVYEFETAAYHTPKGEISMPFRTSFGYHVVKINDKRPSRGTMTAAHIMVGLKQKDSSLNPEERINDIYKKLQQGETFESLAKQFSDDKSSANKGGRLAPFKSGQLSSEKFEDEAFALQTDDAISKPFQSEYGWHIVKRVKLDPVKSFDALKPTLENKVKRDSRSKLINDAMVGELTKRYQISYNPEAKKYFETILDQSFFGRSWRLPEDFDKDQTLFSINNRSFKYSEFGRHLMSAQRVYASRVAPFETVVNKEFDRFFEKSILQYREDNLESENKDFANILKEYRDGLLLFDLMEKEVWNRASKDTVGLEAYYQKYKENYRLPDRVDVVMASSADKTVVESALKMLKRNKSIEDIKARLNTESENNIIFTSGIFEASSSKIPSDMEMVEGLSKVYANNESFHVLNVKELLPARVKTLEEAKGSIVNDYQSEIERNWLSNLHNQFKVEIDKDVLEKVKETIKNQ